MKRTGAETRTRILEAACRLFYARGVRSVSMEEIAWEAGFTKRTVYQHFPTKESLVVAHLEHWNGGPLLAAVRRQQGTPYAQFLGLFTALEAGFAQAGFRGCPFVNAAAELGESEPVRSVAASSKEQLCIWLEGVLRALGARAPQALAEQVAMIVDGAIAARLVRKDPAIAGQAREAALALLHAATAPAPRQRSTTAQRV